MQPRVSSVISSSPLPLPLPLLLVVLVVLMVLLPVPSYAAALDCHNVRVDGRSWNLDALGGRHAVVHAEDHPPVVKNTTFVFDLCKPLERSKCPRGTNVCGIERIVGVGADGKDLITGIIPIAGEYQRTPKSSHKNDAGRALDPKVTALKSDGDSRTVGLRVELHGGQYPFVNGSKNDNNNNNNNGTSNARKQTAVIDLRCDPSRPRARSLAETTTTLNPTRAGTRNSSDIRFISYRPSEENDKNKNVDALHLEWKTKYACQDFKGDNGNGNDKNNDNDDKKDDQKSSHWGFFTWFVIIVFVCVAGYLILGSWLNSAGAGWDALSQLDSLRDVPYILKEWWERLVDAWQGSELRGGYSAV